jgi:hypothetical protein
MLAIILNTCTTTDNSLWKYRINKWKMRQIPSGKARKDLEKTCMDG